MTEQTIEHFVTFDLIDLNFHWTKEIKNKLNFNLSLIFPIRF